ncbi:MAG TPA: hypothetical protein DIW27_02575 [Cytophagales bacterium]|nr:hypothetical protein [Cytophagales bacterium]
MKRKKEYVLEFEGLKSGLHQFDFELDKSFFENIESAEQTHLSEDLVSPVFKINVEMQKESQMLILTMKFNGSAQFDCDLCTSAIQLPIDFSNRVIVKFGDGSYDETDEIILLPEGEHEIDLSHLFYELVMLNLPSRRVCKNEGKSAECNIEILNKLEKIRTKEEEKEIDPRWEILKKINEN